MYRNIYRKYIIIIMQYEKLHTNLHSNHDFTKNVFANRPPSTCWKKIQSTKNALFILSKYVSVQNETCTYKNKNKTSLLLLW